MGEFEETAEHLIEEAVSDLEWKNYLPKTQEKLRKALKVLKQKEDSEAYEESLERRGREAMLEDVEAIENSLDNAEKIIEKMKDYLTSEEPTD